jgi:Ni/Co efflux regulator RcnB
MQLMTRRTSGIIALVVAGIFLAAATVWADKPSWSGGDKNSKHEEKEKHSGKKEKGGGKSSGHGGADAGGHVHFGDHHREVIQVYYRDQFRAGICPPGLAKKNSGCLPPGQAKRWVIGRPLPPDIIVYDLPPVIISQLGPPPPGHRYIRVDSDILLLAVGTSMVIDALQGLSR